MRPLLRRRALGSSCASSSSTRTAPTRRWAVPNGTSPTSRQGWHAEATPSRFWPPFRARPRLARRPCTRPTGGPASSGGSGTTRATSCRDRRPRSLRRSRSTGPRSCTRTTCQASRRPSGRSPAGSGLPVVHSLHDYYLLCPRVTLLGKDGTPCCAHRRFCARRAQRLGRWAAAVSDVVGVSHFVLERHRDVFPRARHHVIRHPVGTRDEPGTPAARGAAHNRLHRRAGDDEGRARAAARGRGDSLARLRAASRRGRKAEARRGGSRGRGAGSRTTAPSRELARPSSSPPAISGSCRRCGRSRADRRTWCSSG